LFVNSPPPFTPETEFCHMQKIFLDLIDQDFVGRDDVAAEINRQAVQDQIDEDVARHDLAEAALLGMTVAEYRRHLEDLQDDAAATGD